MQGRDGSAFQNGPDGYAGRIGDGPSDCLRGESRAVDRMALDLLLDLGLADRDFVHKPVALCEQV
jgi:hypothetical protein